MTQTEKCRILQEIENEFPVYELKYEGVAVWPILRGHLTNHILGISPQARLGQSSNNSFIRIRLIKQAFQFLWYTIIAFINNLSIKKTRPIDWLFLIRSNQRLEIVEKRRFARFGNSLQYFMGKTGNFQTIDLLPINPTSHFPVYGKTYFSFFQYHFQRMSALKKKSQQLDSSFMDFGAFLKSKDISFSKVKMLLLLKEVFTHKAGHLRMLKKYRPKSVVYECYYSKEIFGLTLACHDYKIKAIEIQHGQQGAFHPMYTNWGNYPKEGNPCLPDVFFMWGKQSVDRIKHWINGYHQIVKGGNPWLAFVKEREITVDENIVNQFESKISTASKKVLISCQFIEDIFTDSLKDAIKNSSKDMIWIFRLHPRFKGRKQEVVQWLKNIHCQNFEIDYCNELPLYYLLKKVDIQITFWSTVAYEALAFDVPTIIIHENGKKGMKDYIEKGIFGYAQTGKEILNLIHQNKFVKEEIEEEFIISDAELIRNEFFKIPI